MRETIKSPGGACQRRSPRTGSSSETIVVGGELDATTVPLLRDVLMPLIRVGGRVRIDLRDVTFIDSSGLHLLAETAAALGTTGRVVVDPSRAVQRAIGLIGPELKIHIDHTGRHGAA